MAQPAYKRIQHYILSQIDSDKLKPGEQIPTEMALATQFSVSRMTVNKAIVELSQQHILTRIAGKGTFVTQQQAELSLTEITDFAEEIQLRGQQYRTHVLTQEWRTITGEIASQLSMADGETAGYCEILHIENNTPLIWESRYVNPLHVPGFMHQDFSTITPTAYLLKHSPLTEMEHTVEAINVNNKLAEKLHITPQIPCLQITRRTWSDGILISYTQLVSAGSRYQLRSRYQTQR